MYDLYILLERWLHCNSTTTQRVHEQSLTGICTFPVFYLLLMDYLCTNRELKQKNTQSLEHTKH